MFVYIKSKTYINFFSYLTMIILLHFVILYLVPIVTGGL